MCYDISFKTNVEVVSDYFPDVVFDNQIHIDYERAIHIMGHAYGEHPVLYAGREDHKPHMRLMEWGCIPYYVKEEDKFIRQRASMLNARSERILDDTKSYWYKIRNRRCLVPVSAIFEHRAITGWKKKVPYHVSLKDQQMFFLPGLYSVAELPDKTTGEMIKRFSYTIITRGANELMKQIHNDGDNKFRMPLFLPIELSRQWLDEDLSAEQYKTILDFEMPSENLDCYPVYTIRSPKERPDGKQKDALYEWDQLPRLN